MRIIAVYRPNSEHGRTIETFLHDFGQRYMDIKVEVADIDTRDGSATASLYDIVHYPALLAVRDDGTVLNIWENDQLPLMDEVAGYAYA